ncbi:hypothetical protein M3Y98_00292100 [Aphelenchoides besseyi]|nr:hypothetical protein M3Y98_00292100 [Aphelenchoides besseyi]
MSIWNCTSLMTFTPTVKWSEHLFITMPIDDLRTMLRPFLFFSTFLLISARAFEQSERRYEGTQDAEDECLVYEDEVIFLDSLQPTPSAQYEQPSSLSDQTSNNLNYLPTKQKNRQI